MAAHAYVDWIGRDRSVEDAVSLDRARKLAATLDLDPDALRTGDRLPLGWHWIYHHEHARRSALADDGHEERGEFLPPIPLERRMWAGGRLRFVRPIPLGSEVRRVSTVRSIDLKEGRSGPLAFVKVEHRLSDNDGVLIEEEQDIVYLNRPPAERAAMPGGAAEGASRVAETEPDGAGAAVDWSEATSLDEVALFRFSALTFNGHRIHYDRPYAVDVEGYPDVVVHGPLLALLLLGAGGRWMAESTGASPGREPVRFSYRSLQPVFCNEQIRLCGSLLPPSGGDLWVEHPTRGVVVRAEMLLGG